MIKIAPNQPQFKKFLLAVMPAVSSYVKWSKRSLVFDYFGGSRNAMIERAHEKLSQYFNDWSEHMPGDCYQQHDGSGTGGGVTGPVCYFGQMPCYLTLRFWDNQIEVEVRMVTTYTKYACDRVPGHLIYTVRVFSGTEVFASEECFFDNILK